MNNAIFTEQELLEIKKKELKREEGKLLAKVTLFIEALSIGQVEWLQLEQEAIKAQVKIYDTMYKNALSKKDAISKAIVKAHEEAIKVSENAVLKINDLRRKLDNLIETDIEKAENLIKQLKNFKPQSLEDIEVLGD